VVISISAEIPAIPLKDFLPPINRRMLPVGRTIHREEAVTGHCQLNAKIYTFVQEQEEQDLVSTFMHPWILAL
jgi:hypothetical protein